MTVIAEEPSQSLGRTWKFNNSTGSSPLLRCGDRLLQNVRRLATAFSPQRINHREHRPDLCELPIHIRDL